MKFLPLPTPHDPEDPLEVLDPDPTERPLTSDSRHNAVTDNIFF